jgi:hypothetical protein
MSIDERARAATDELRTATASGVHMATISEIEKASASRRRTRAALAAATAVVVLGGAWGLSLDRGRAAGDPAGPGTVSPSGPATRTGVPQPTRTGPFALCSFDHVTCLGGRTVRADLPAPVTVVLPVAFQTDMAEAHATVFEVFGDVPGEMSGVAVLEDATPSAPHDPSTPDPTGGSTAEAASRWLASRPFIQPTTPQRLVLDGLTAYRVHVVLRPGTRLVGTPKEGEPTAATFASGKDSWSAVSSSLSDTTYYLLDVPGGGLTVVWSWSFGPATNESVRTAYVKSMRFG